MKGVITILFIILTGDLLSQNLSQKTADIIIANTKEFVYNKKTLINKCTDNLIDKYTLLEFTNDSALKANFTFDKSKIETDTKIYTLEVPKKLRTKLAKTAWTISNPVKVGNISCVMAICRKKSGGRKDLFIYNEEGKLLRVSTSTYVY